MVGEDENISADKLITGSDAILELRASDEGTLQAVYSQLPSFLAILGPFTIRNK